MSVRATDDEYAVKYFLGELTEAEQARLEERYFDDAPLSDLLSEGEDDLIDQYAREELSRRPCERFENHFLISERRRAKLRTARVLLESERAGTLSPTAARQDSPPWWKAIVSPFLVPRRAPSYGLAAFALFAMMGGWWLASEVRQLQREVAETNASRARSEQHAEQLRQQGIEHSRRNDELVAQNEQLERQTSQLKQQVETAKREPPTAAAFVTFVLSTGYRSSDGPRRLIVPRGIQTVRLQLNLNPDDEYSSYQATLRTASGEPVRSWRELRTRSTAGERTVFLAAPAGLLNEVQYELTLSGVADSGVVEDLGYYYFVLQKN